MDKNSISKNLITLCILELDYCSLTFGVLPCEATGTKCYNTFKTCKDKLNYNKTTRQYRFINSDAPAAAAANLNARPYILDFSPLSTELKDDKTIPARGTITFADEEDFDKGIDPYWSDRSHANILSVPGTFWKKLIERNPYYKGRIITIKQGFSGQSENEFTTIFSGKIQKITRNKREVTLEYSDDIIDLSEIEYPYKTAIKLTADLGCCYEAENVDKMIQLSDARIGDFCIRKDYADITVTVTGASSEATAEHSFYSIIAFNTQDCPIARCDLMLGYETGTEFLTFQWDDVPGASYYRIYGAHEEMDTYDQFTESYYECYVNTNFNNVGTPPQAAERYFKLTSVYFDNPLYWVEQLSPLTADISGTTDLDSSGYIQLNDEVIYYSSLGVNQLVGLKRVRFKTKSKIHFAGTNLKLVESEAPKNPFTLLLGRFSRAGIPSGRIDSATISAYASAYNGINYSTKPIIKNTNAGKLIFDLARALDISLWVNEEGKITCKKNDEDTSTASVNDADNIVLDSKSVDFNDDDIRTRINFYYNRNDVTKGTDDKENYSNLHIEINADAEGANMYNKSIPEDIITTWINDDCGTLGEIQNHVQELCKEKLRRLASPRPKLTFEVEQKDNSIAVGNIITLTSNAFNDINGNDYQGRKAEVIKKTPKGLKIELTVRLLAEEEITTESEDHQLIYDNPVPLRDFGLNEIKVAGFKIFDMNDTEYSTDNLDVEAEIKLKLQWNNFYASSPSTVTDINGVTHALPKRLIYSGFPPIPFDEEVDTSSLRTTKRYKVYMFVANTGAKYPVTKRPTLNDANGKWYMIGSVPDLHSDNDEDVYTFTYNIPISLVGRYIGFDVYADANVVYDPNVPVSIDLEVLQ